MNTFENIKDLPYTSIERKCDNKELNCDNSFWLRWITYKFPFITASNKYQVEDRYTEETTPKDLTSPKETTPKDLTSSKEGKHNYRNRYKDIPLKHIARILGDIMYHDGDIEDAIDDRDSDVLDTFPLELIKESANSYIDDGNAAIHFLIAYGAISEQDILNRYIANIRAKRWKNVHIATSSIVKPLCSMIKSGILKSTEIANALKEIKPDTSTVDTLLDCSAETRAGNNAMREIARYASNAAIVAVINKNKSYINPLLEGSEDRVDIILSLAKLSNKVKKPPSRTLTYVITSPKRIETKTRITDRGKTIQDVINLVSKKYHRTGYDMVIMKDGGDLRVDTKVDDLLSGKLILTVDYQLIITKEDVYRAVSETQRIFKEGEKVIVRYDGFKRAKVVHSNKDVTVNYRGQYLVLEREDVIGLEI